MSCIFQSYFSSGLSAIIPSKGKRKTVRLNMHKLKGEGFYSLSQKDRSFLFLSQKDSSFLYFVPKRTDHFYILSQKDRSFLYFVPKGQLIFIFCPKRTAHFYILSQRDRSWSISANKNRVAINPRSVSLQPSNSLLNITLTIIGFY